MIIVVIGLLLLVVAVGSFSWENRSDDEATRLGHTGVHAGKRVSAAGKRSGDKTTPASTKRSSSSSFAGSSLKERPNARSATAGVAQNAYYTGSLTYVQPGDRMWDNGFH